MVAAHPVTDQVLGARVVPALGRVGARLDTMAVGEVVATGAATRDQAWIWAVGNRADEVAGAAVGAQPAGGSDFDEHQWCIIRKAPIACEELAQIWSSAGALADVRDMGDCECSPDGGLNRRLGHPRTRSGCDRTPRSGPPAQ
jgi:hypothetical protein